MAVRTKDRVTMDVAKEMQAAASLVRDLATIDDNLRADMVEGETGLFEAIDAALEEIDECQIMAVGIAAKMKEMDERKRRVEFREMRLRGLIEQAMTIADLPSIKTATATLTVKNVPPKPVYEDESAIPAEFWKQPDPVLDKVKIKDAIKDGREVPGVTMTNGTTSMQIRRS